MLKAFLVGMYEFRRSVTSNFGVQDEAYEVGREFAHMITLRHFDC